ncbi:hypothetical protein BCV72DRAFT_312682, partial [Rhizopus microsporus var. microsporus]
SKVKKCSILACRCRGEAIQCSPGISWNAHFKGKCMIVAGEQDTSRKSIELNKSNIESRPCKLPKVWTKG